MRDFLKYPPLFLGMHLIIGILLAKFLKVDFYSEVSAAVFGLLVIIILLRKKLRLSQFVERILIACVMLFIGMTSFMLTDDRNNAQYFEKISTTISDTSIVVEVKEILKSNKIFERFVVEVVQIGKKSTVGNVLLYVKRDSMFHSKVGSRYLCFGNIREISKPKNPFEFDYAAYLEGQNVYGQLYIEATDIKVLKPNENSFIVIVRNFRANLIAKLQANGFENDVLAVMGALLLGDRNYVSADLRSAYINAGAIHILAISGLHIGILFLLISTLLKPLEYFKHGKQLNQILILAVLWWFALLAGMSASVIRAVTMFSAVSIGVFLNRKNSVYHSLIASAFILLLIRPRFLFEVGFQLSYAAVFSIVWLQPKLESIVRVKLSFVNYFWKLFTVSFAAQLGVLPLSLYYFHQFPGLFFVSNLVIIPLLGGILCVGILILLLVVLDLKINALFDLYAWLIQQLNSFINVVSEVDFFVLDGIYWSVGLLVSSYILLLSFFKWSEKRTRKRFGIAVVAICLFYAVLFIESALQEEQDELVIFHKSRATLFGVLKGNFLQVFGANETDLPSFFESYQSGKGIKKVQMESKIPNLLNTKENPIVVLDSLGLYGFRSVSHPILVLRNSPKVNFDRVLKIVNPKIVIADGSNYKSYVSRWKMSALKTKTPFHDTSQKGAYILKPN